MFLGEKNIQQDVVVCLQLVVLTSDIRVSERVCLSSITLDCHDTVYNDLIEEVYTLLPAWIWLTYNYIEKQTIKILN